MFWSPIMHAIPQIVAVLGNVEYNQAVIANALSKLSEICEFSAICLQEYANIISS
jgi:hypothetical protein